MSAREMQEYAWGWFEYHAGQRLVTFRFFLIVLGVLMVGLSSSVEDENVFLSSAIAASASFIALAFLMLEIRNEQLVNVGREALKKLEESEDFRNAPPELKMFHIDDNRCVLVSHKTWLRVIYLLCLVVFGILAIFPKVIFS